MRRGQTLGNAAELAADGSDRNIEQRHRSRAEDQRDNRAGHTPLPTPRPQFDDGKGCDRDYDCWPLEGPKMFSEDLHLFDELRWHLIHVKAEKILHLRREDEDGNAAGE